MADQADLTPARALADKAAKGRFVYDTLYQQAQQSQAGVLALLSARGVPHRSYYIVNAVWVRGTAPSRSSWPPGPTSRR